MKHYELKIGLVVTIGLFLIILGLHLTNSLPFLSQGYRIHMKLSYGANVPMGASVKLAGGIKIGRLESVRENPEEGGVILTLFIESRYKINKDAMFVIQTASLVGEKYIDILNYTGNPPYLKDGDTVIGKEVASINQAISDVFDFIKRFIGKIESAPELPQSIDKVVLLISYLELILREINENKEYITVSLKNASEFSEQLRESAQEINALLTSLNHVSSNLNKVDIKKLNDTINNLNYVATELSKVITNTNNIIGLLSDEELAKSLRRTVKNLEVFSKKIADNPSALINILGW
ncbi:MAG: MlaD family protein [Brevinematia bacterium]